MQTVVKQDSSTLLVLGDQEVKNTGYRPIKYLHQVNVDDGALIYNALTTELFFLDEKDLSVFTNPEKFDINVLEPFIKKWLLVPVDNDDLKLSNQFLDTMLLLNKTTKVQYINSYTILPTTDCNARCFYCYELGCNRRDMSPQTASDVADYIIKKCDKNAQIRITWFGGEPLYNVEAIDIICDKLNDAGINFTSKMVSNGYLFDEDTVKRAKDNWHMKRVQITLDGTEEIYNRVKAYIYKDGQSAFKRVMKNIELLLDEDIAIHARMNMDEHNVDDLYVLTDYLFEKFGSYKKFSVYGSLLYENYSKKISNRGIDEKLALADRFTKLMQSIVDRNGYSVGGLRVTNRMSHCMADNDGAVMILPDGNLGKCEHYSDDNFFGNIYSDEIDYDVINEFKETLMIDATQCPDCKLQPYCRFLKKCLNAPHHCDECDKHLRIHDLETKLLNSYEEFKNKKEKNL